MTTAAAVPLQSLAQHIARQESELEALRQEYQTRQARLADLESRKEELQRELRKLDAEIQAVDRGKTPPSTFASAKGFPAKPTPAAAHAKTVRPKTLSARLVQLVREAKGPLTVKQFTDEVVRRKYPTSSKNIPGLIQTRLRELVFKGILQHAGRRSGYVLGTSQGNGMAAPGKLGAGEVKSKPRALASKKTPSKREIRPSQKPLRVVLHELLAKSRRPLRARDLAEQAKAQGYHSTSKDFVQVVWVALANMDNVENVPDRGYRLTKR